MARYIDADKLLEDLQEEIDFEALIYTEEQNKWFNAGLKCAVRNVKHQPTTDVVEVQHGKWEDIYQHKYDNHKYICSICCGDAPRKIETDELYSTVIKQDLSPFCPNCGAKMDGRGDTE